jgi:hypothetical protein
MDFVRRIFVEDYANQAERIGEAIVKLGPDVRLSKEAIEAMAALAKKVPDLKPDDLAQLRNVARYGRDLTDPLRDLTDDADRFTGVVRAQWRFMEEVAGKTGNNTGRLLGVTESNQFVRNNVVFNPPRTRGVPDNLIVDGDIVKGAEEYKNFAPETWASMKQAVDELPDKSQFVAAGVVIDGTTFRVQFFQHKNTLSDFGVLPGSAEYVLKISDNVADGIGSDVRSLVGLLENHLGVNISVEKIPLSTIDINSLVRKLRTDMSP